MGKIVTFTLGLALLGGALGGPASGAALAAGHLLGAPFLGGKDQNMGAALWLFCMLIGIVGAYMVRV